MSLIKGILAGMAGGGAPPGPFAVSGTEQEDGVLTITGGTPPYTVHRASDFSLLASGVTSYTIPAGLVGDEIEVLDSAAGYHLTAVIGSSALAWFSAADYAAGEIQNRGLMTYPVADDSLGGPAVGTDALGPYCDFAGVDGMQTTVAEIPPYAGTAFTVYCLIDTAAGAASTFAADMYQASPVERISVRHVTGGNLDILLTNEGYKTYGKWTDDASELSCFVFNGTTGDRKGYHDAAVHSGEGATPNGFTTAVDFSFGGLFSGVQAPDGKLRFLAIYPSAHDATKRAEVRAALKRTWAHVDQTALEIPGLRVLCNAESGNVTERVDGSDLYAEDATDLSGNGNGPSNATTTEQPLIITDPGGRWNGKRVLESPDGLRFLQKASFDLGGTSDEHAMGFAMEFIAYSSNARIFCLTANAGQPRIYTPGSGGNSALQNGTDTTFTGTATPLDTPSSLIGTFKSGVSQQGYSGGRLEDEDVPSATITWADGGTHTILAYVSGSLGLQMRVGEWFIARTAFTPTLALVHGCRHHVEYGTALA